jgi:hypothetical protein
MFPLAGLKTFEPRITVFEARPLFLNEVLELEPDVQIRQLHDSMLLDEQPFFYTFDEDEE